MSASTFHLRGARSVQDLVFVLFASAGSCFCVRPGAEAPAAETARVAAHAASVSVLTCASSPRAPDVATRRLSVREYRNTLSDLFADQQALHVATDDIAIELAQLPLDGEAGESFPDMDARTTQRHFETYLKIADKIARAITSNDSALRSLGAGCASVESLDQSCFLRFLQDFGARAWRRPLSADELARLERLAQADAPRDAYRLAIAELLAAPDFLFHVERGAEDAGERNGAQRLGAYELAARLSYHFWQTMPDAELERAAQSGALETAAGYRAQVARITQHHRARSTWYRFFRDWLKLDDFGGFAQDRAFKQFAGSLETPPELYQDAVWEIEQLAGYYTFDTRGSYRELMTSDRAVTRSLRLARLYGVAPWDGHSQPLAFPDAEHTGLLTRAALMISASHATNPFRRGAFVARQLLCETLDQPTNLPPGALSLPHFDPLASTRTRYEHKVEAPECQFCHVRFAPFGYALEPYDALGRHRRSERLFDDNGDERGQTAIDAHVTVFADGDEREVSGPVELSHLLADSAQATECFARQYFRFTFHRRETASDACAIGALVRSLKESGLGDFYRNIAFTDAFRTRVTAAETQGAAP